MTGVLPMVEFLNGHSFFVTQLHKKYNTKPVALHATYQFGDTPEYSYGKRERLRQAVHPFQGLLDRWPPLFLPVVVAQPEEANLHFRQAGFLQSSRLPKAVLNSRAKLPQNLCKCQSEAANEEKLAQCEHEYWGTLRADDTLEYAPGEGKVATHGQAVHKDAYHLHPMTMPESAAASPEDAKLKQARILEVDVKALDTFCWSGNAQFDRSMRAALDMHTGFCPRELNKIPPNWKPETHPLNCSWGYTVPTPLGVVSKERRENMKQT
eukprot:gene11304-13356_t